MKKELEYQIAENKKALKLARREFLALDGTAPSIRQAELN